MQDYAEAMTWFHKAADQGYATAQTNLGVMYTYGEGVPQDYTEALRWYGKAAERGDALAQYNFGIMYANGRGTPQNYVQAHMWFSLAATRFSPWETELHELALMNRDLVATNMTPAQIAEAERLAREWKPK